MMKNMNFQLELLISLVLIGFVFSFAIQNCQEGEYWDFSLENCEKCNLICDQAAERDNVEDCERKCPGFLESKKSTTPRIDGSSSTTEKPQNYMDLLDRLIIPGSVFVVIGLAFVVAIAMYPLYRPYLKLPLLGENGKGPGCNNAVPQIELNPLNNVNDKLLINGQSACQEPLIGNNGTGAGCNNEFPQENPIDNGAGNATMIVNGESHQTLIDRQSPPSGRSGVQETQLASPVHPDEEGFFGTTTGFQRSHGLDIHNRI